MELRKVNQTFTNFRLESEYQKHGDAMRQIAVQRPLNTAEKHLAGRTQELHKLSQQYNKLCKESKQNKEQLEMQKTLRVDLELAIAMYQHYYNEVTQPQPTEMPCTESNVQ
jgi:hypothetical protein